MKAADKYILLFVISTLLTLSGCEKADVDDGIPPSPTPTDTSDTTPTDTIDRNTGERDGSIQHPFTADDIATGSLGWYVNDAHIELADKWVSGYIVGYIAGKNIEYTVFDIGYTESNIVLASSPDETDVVNIVPVQLSKGGRYQETRDALNLADNPDMLGQPVLVRGTICTYMGTIGIKKTNDYRYDD